MNKECSDGINIFCIDISISFLFLLRQAKTAYPLVDTSIGIEV